ncbi:TPA: hypothetical protein ACH3X2_005239 [Trebouxia sp. C0005]
MKIRLTAIAVWLLSWLVFTVAAELSDECTTPNATIYTIHLEDNVPAELKLSASVAAGLINRHTQAPSVFNAILPPDLLWLASAKEDVTMSGCTWVALSVVELWQLAWSLGATNGTVLYDPTETWSLATVVTLCGIHSALPVAASQQPVHRTRLHQWLHTAVTAVQHYILSWLQRSPQDGSASQSKYTIPLDLGYVILDTRGMWANDLQATSWAIDHLFLKCKQTSEMVAIQVPELIKQGLLADFIVARQLFAFWLPDLCQPGTSAHGLFAKITQTAWHQQSLLTVIGYFASQEEIAACSQHHTEVALVSDWSPNLSFWSRMTPVATLHQSPALPLPPYSSNCAYVAIITSDGDSLQMNYNSMRGMMDTRAAICSSNSSVCPPVSWTISSRLATLAPFVLRWHYRQAALRWGSDSFLLGPSGYGFLHPTAIAPHDSLRQVMINMTSAAAAQLDMSSYVHWDEYDNSNTHQMTSTQYSGLHADETLLLKSDSLKVGTAAMEGYIANFQNTSIQAVFSPITPYVHRWIGKVATFRELIRWTGSATHRPSDIADMLLQLSRGTMGYVYKLPDITMQDVEDLGLALQNTHVKLVGHRELTMLAAQAKPMSAV